MISSGSPFVIVESPYGDPSRQVQLRNKLYLSRCLRDSWDMSEIPFASHGFFPLFLSEGIMKEREDGIAAGYYMWKFAEYMVVYTDLGISPGMKQAIQRADEKSFHVRYRTIGKDSDG